MHSSTLYPFSHWRLGHAEVLRFDEPVRLAAVRGSVWITVDGSPEDIVLEPGDSRGFDGRARVLATPLQGDALVGVLPQAARPGGAPWHHALRFWQALVPWATIRLRQAWQALVQGGSPRAAA